ncbi:hypothetical protein D9758_017219 [Tetrapyrgos nigripes]|uniref:Uncharacterized protein n=1 Tax=Tetrapyrgos nigripes TaxID=182062 RepID=A0A8H5C308_9AGAR|nr:hypothetical protein D9758_017219 [Tetrapyrgos nigripes]
MGRKYASAVAGPSVNASVTVSMGQERLQLYITPPRLSFGDFWKHTFQRTQCSGTVHSAASGATTDGFIGAFVLNGAASMRKGIKIEVPKKTNMLTVV